MAEASQALQSKPVSDKGKSLGNLIKQVTPTGVDPKVYYELISTQIMGTDRQGKPRGVEDMLYFLNVAKKLNLDPLVKQIYPVYRWDSKLGREKMTIQTGIDGFRLIAQRTGEYGGSDDAVFSVEEIFNPVTGEIGKQLKATVTVYKVKGGERMPVTASARWNEYAQKGKDKQGKEYYSGLWASMPMNQLSKCSEALALRKAFPKDLSGVYISEELDRERTTGLDLPTPKSIEEKKAKKTEIPSPDEIGKKMTEVVNSGVEAAKGIQQVLGNSAIEIKEVTENKDKKAELLSNFEEVKA